MRFLRILVSGFVAMVVLIVGFFVAAMGFLLLLPRLFKGGRASVPTQPTARMPAQRGDVIDVTATEVAPEPRESRSL
jgi:hypothetical protein